MRKSEGAEPSTVNRNLAHLRRMFKLAQRDGKIQVVPYFPMLPENAARRGFLEPRDFDTLLNALPQHLQPIVMFLYESGARKGEARKIRWEQVDLSAAEIRLYNDQTKSGEPRILPLSQKLVGVLKKMFRTDGPVFGTAGLRRAWQDACVAVGLGAWEDAPKLKRGRVYRGLLIHDLRRSAIRNLIRAGVSESVAMKISGHQTREIFQRYDVTSTTDLHSAAAAVQNNNERLMKGAGLQAAEQT